MMVSKYSVKKNKIFVISNGCNIESMAAKDKVASRVNLGIDLNVFVVGFVGHLHPWQGIDVIIEAVSSLKTSGYNVIAVIAGTSNDISNYFKLADDLGVKNEVLFLGAIRYEDVAEVISCFDVGVAPGAKIVDSNYLFIQQFGDSEFQFNLKTFKDVGGKIFGNLLLHCDLHGKKSDNMKLVLDVGVACMENIWKDQKQVEFLRYLLKNEFESSFKVINKKKKRKKK